MWAGWFMGRLRRKGALSPIAALRSVQQGTSIRSTYHRAMGVNFEYIPALLEDLVEQHGLTVTGQIGKGGFATVYEGADRLTGEKVAIKYIKRSSIKKEDRHLLQNEIDAYCRLEHPSIIRVKKIINDPCAIAIIMEHFPGDLLAYVNLFRLDEAHARHIFTQVLCALQYAHKKGFAHLDVKLENILVSGERVALCDWGLCEKIRPNTMIRTSRGSVYYSSPEILRNENVDGRAADVWSLGVILYALLMNKLPFMANTAYGMLEQIEQGITLTAAADDLSSDVRDLIGRMLNVDSLSRITIDEILQHTWMKLMQQEKEEPRFEDALEDTRIQMSSDFNV